MTARARRSRSEIDQPPKIFFSRPQRLKLLLLCGVEGIGMGGASLLDELLELGELLELEELLELLDD